MSGHIVVVARFQGETKRQENDVISSFPFSMDATFSTSLFSPTILMEINSVAVGEDAQIAFSGDRLATFLGKRAKASNSYYESAYSTEEKESEISIERIPSLQDNEDSFLKATANE
ncbi:hypothetical protein TNIN_362041 [Trichonephila inaurata madagascariensis]|uniref:Uncharacterized protein n=1 Tax=Trichonephila inaurata madagascariensis TaxID=2747483 RepID=A0A8X6XLI1_9ARAC|nr:hypothetical protein TNIN_362041 [Trichonephila inaurata madagascariensis]